ncbi:MAG: DNA-3-methyladenine glycosylase family protein [Flavobacteriales bacterium]
MYERVHAAFLALLVKTDPDMQVLVHRQGPLPLPAPRPPFEALVRTVVGQQLSVKAASTISARLTSACDGQLEPRRIQALSMETLRGAGLSQSKADCVLRVADMAGPDGLCLERLTQMPSLEWRKELLQIKGLGPWSCDMFGMFGLGDLDMFSAGDLGLRNAMVASLGMGAKEKPAAFELRADRWKPYRTVASLHLWKSLDNQPK